MAWVFIQACAMCVLPSASRCGVSDSVVCRLSRRFLANRPMRCRDRYISLEIDDSLMLIRFTGWPGQTRYTYCQLQLCKSSTLAMTVAMTTRSTHIHHRLCPWRTNRERKHYARCIYSFTCDARWLFNFFFSEIIKEQDIVSQMHKYCWKQLTWGVSCTPGGLSSIISDFFCFFST